MSNSKSFLADSEKVEGVRVVSNCEYFDVFTELSCKPEIFIPDTLIMQGWEIKGWVFNKRNESRAQILCKNEDKLNAKDIFPIFTSLRIDDYSLSEMIENAKKSGSDYYAVVKTNNGEKLFLKDYELKMILEKGMDNISMIQKRLIEYQPRKYLNPLNNLNETYYCFAKRDSEYNQFTFKYFKKSMSYSNITKKRAPFLENIVKQTTFPDISLEDFSTVLSDRHYSSSNIEKDFYKSFDTGLNEKLQKMANTLIIGIQTSYRFSIKCFLMKFLIDNKQKVNFIGGQDMIIFPTQNLPEMIELKDLVEILGLKKKRSTNTKNLKLPENTEKIYSDKLFSKMIVETCEGDFCDYILNSRYQLTSNIKNPDSGIPLQNKIYGKIQSKVLPYEIPWSLIRNVREKPEPMASFLKLRNVAPPEKGPKDLAILIPDYGYMIFKKHTTGNNPHSLYRLAKVCTKCFQIYSLLQEELKKVTEIETMSKNPEKKWIHTEIKFNQYVRSSLQLYPSSTKSENDKQISLKEAKEFMHHTVGLYLMSKHEIRNTTQTAIKVNEQRIPGINQLDKYGKTPLLPKIAQTPMSIKNKSPSPMSKSVKHSVTMKNFEKNEGFNSDENATRRLALGLVSKKESVSYRPRVHSGKASNRDSPSNRNLNEKIIVIPDSDDYLTFARHFINFNSGSSDESVPKLDILGMRYPRNTINSASTKKDLTESPKYKPSHELDAHRDRVLQSISAELERKFKRRSTSTAFLEVKKKIFEPNKSEIGICISMFHYKKFTARLLPKYKHTNFKMPLQKSSNFSTLLSKFDIVDFYLYQKLGKFNLNRNLSSDITDNIFGFIYSEHIAIPLYILDSGIMEENAKFYEIFIVIHDIFDDFLDYVGIYKKILEHQVNKRMIFFHIPGQSFTIYPNDFIPTNEACGEILDSLLFRLDQSGVASIEKDHFNFIGYGYGGNILLYFLAQNDNLLPNFKNLMLVNSFSYIDELLTKTLHEMMAIIEEAPDDLPELPFEFFSLLVHSKKQKEEIVKQQLQTNQITKDGRIKILTGCLNSLNIRKKVPDIEMNLCLVHSLNNCFIDISHVDVFMNNLDDKFGVKKNSLNELMYKKKSHFVEGGHAILRESLEKFMPILYDFIGHNQI